LSFQSVVLDGDNILSLGTLLAFDNFEFYSLAFIKGFETFGNDRVEVDENISARIALDETVALATIEPFYNTLFSRHDLELLSFKIFAGLRMGSKSKVNLLSRTSV